MVELWAEDKELRLNTSKTKAIVISRKRHPPVLKLTLCGTQIEQVTSFKYLGVTISQDLSWNLHIAGTCSRARRLLGFIYRSFGGGTEPRALVRLYSSLVLPVLDYCSSIWDPLFKTLVDKLEKVQSFAARLVTGRWMDPVEDLSQSLGWPLLAKRRVFQKLCLCRRILLGGSLIPPSVFVPHPSPSARSHANSQPLFRQGVRTRYHQQSFFVSVVSKWNSIPGEMVELSSHLAFKRHLKQYLVL